MPTYIPHPAIIEEQKKRRKQQEKELERVYQEIAEPPLPEKKKEEKPIKIEISLE